MTLGPRALILCYHRVAEPQADPWGLCVGPTRFAEQMQVLRTDWQPVPLTDLVARLRADSLRDRSVAVTFDDGYRDNLVVASEWLTAAEVPATMFVVTGDEARPTAFWWDDLERLLLHPGRLPDRLRLSVNGRSYEWALGSSANYRESDAQRHRSWRAWEDPPTPRHAAYYSLWAALQTSTQDERARVLAVLEALADRGDTPLESRQLLTAEELARLSRVPGIDIGAHTVTHPTLAALPVSEQRREIAASRARLTADLDLPIHAFAYPYGAAGNYTNETVALVREAGFLAACTTRASAVDTASDLFRLPRLQVEDWDAAHFGRRMSEWIAGAE
jgi:peptidoglycan/xylan/chitin deacetylase (PgdA/CDA1 family)